MNMPLSKEEKRRLVINTDEFLIRTGITSKERGAKVPYSKSEEGRDRRQQRRNAIARKREWLA